MFSAKSGDFAERTTKSENRQSNNEKRTTNNEKRKSSIVNRKTLTHHINNYCILNTTGNRQLSIENRQPKTPAPQSLPTLRFFYLINIFSCSFF
jgi:hypothetical protein